MAVPVAGSQPRERATITHWHPLAERAASIDNLAVQICVATDLSDSGRDAIAHGMAWAKAFDAELLLLHIVSDPELAPAFSDDVAGDMQRANTALRAIAEQADVPCQVDVRAAEDIAAEIVEASRNSDYLFIGSQGKSAFERMRMGSVATHVVRQSTVPIVGFPHPRED